MRLHVLAGALVALAAASCAAPPAEPAAVEVADLLTGTFSSSDQHETAEDAYFDLRVVIVPIWPERLDGPWLYFEQAIGSRSEAPYRQRVLRVRFESASSVALDDFSLPGDPTRWAGAWASGAPLGDLLPEELVSRPGCAVRLRRQPDGTWRGTTDGRDCASDVRGAAYATTEMSLRDGLLHVWNRGFDEHGTQVWGPEKGPYRLVKLARTAPASN